MSAEVFGQECGSAVDVELMTEHSHALSVMPGQTHNGIIIVREAARQGRMCNVVDSLLGLNSHRRVRVVVDSLFGLDSHRGICDVIDSLFGWDRHRRIYDVVGSLFGLCSHRSISDIVDNSFGRDGHGSVRDVVDSLLGPNWLLTLRILQIFGIDELSSLHKSRRDNVGNRYQPPAI
jgi:hypothetical protein